MTTSGAAGTSKTHQMVACIVWHAPASSIAPGMNAMPLTKLRLLSLAHATR